MTGKGILAQGMSRVGPGLDVFRGESEPKVGARIGLQNYIGTTGLQCGGKAVRSRA